VSIVHRFAIVVSILAFTCPHFVRAQQTKKRFTVADEIGLTLFGDANGEDPELHFSPDKKYVAVWSERGLLDANRVEDALSFYRSQDMRNFVEAKSNSASPLWVVTRTEKEGRIIDSEWRWLADSSGVAFLQRSPGGTQSLVLADINKKTVEPLTAPSVGLNSFDIHDRNHYVYTAADPSDVKDLQRREDAARDSPAIVGTGRHVMELISPDDPITKEFSRPKSYLWAVLGGSPFEVKDDGAAISPARELALSPDNQTVVTRTKAPNIPSSWERLFPPPYPSDPDRLQPGKTNVFQFVRIDLKTGAVQSLADAPISDDGGNWAWVEGPIRWSNDGRAVLLPGTYIKPQSDTPSRPCVAVVDFTSNTRSCVEMLKGHTETGREVGYYPIGDVQFINGEPQHVSITALDHDYQCSGITDYAYREDRTWQATGQKRCAPERAGDDLQVTVQQGVNEPPRFVASIGQKSRVVWDPNPQLTAFDLGNAKIYKWKDKDGHEWEDGLYTPPDFRPGKRYPLVIQTHGFPRTHFTPSGVFPTAYAARELAAQGMVVLQLAYHCSTEVDPKEGPCMAAEFASAAKQLVADGIADPDKIGIVGFSRSCFHVMEALIFHSLPIKAASLTDGVMFTYLQQMTRGGPGDEGELIIGAPPFGEGLQQWFKRSPGFNLDRVDAPLMIVAEGPWSLLNDMWEPYAGLRYQKKPVDLIVLNTDEHVLTNPAVRMASQGGSVDWFRFWLQDYEDPDPAKAEQYERWRGLRKMQADNEKKSSTTNIPKN
jgi:dipeptidyl aminopeptidase/acylaminoacyl peptidase